MPFVEIAILLLLLYLAVQVLQPVVNPIMDLAELVVCGLIAIIVIACGAISDWRHEWKVRRGEASDRLPWCYRFKGWRSDLRVDADSYK